MTMAGWSDDFDEGNESRSELLAECLASRTEELRSARLPVEVNADYLKFLNLYLFQDCFALGELEYEPGRFRDALEDYEDWRKTRELPAYGDQICSMPVYSRMQEKDVERLNGLLGTVRNQEFSSKGEFVEWMTGLYAELDYIHPFQDGNSRTLRVFTDIVARHYGYKLDWKLTNESEKTRNDLCIARDGEVLKRSYDTIADDTLKAIVRASSNALDKVREREGISLKKVFAAVTKKYDLNRQKPFQLQGTYFSKLWHDYPDFKDDLKLFFEKQKEFSPEHEQEREVAMPGRQRSLPLWKRARSRSRSM